MSRSTKRAEGCPRGAALATLALVVAVALGCGGSDAGPAGDLFIASGNGQAGDGEHLLPNPLKVRLIGTNGSVRGGVPVEFEIMEGPGAFLTERFVTTNDNGIAQTFLTLGILPVRHVVRARVAGSEVYFEAYGTNATPPEPVLFSDQFTLPQSITFDNNGLMLIGTGLFGEIASLDSAFRQRTYSRGEGHSFRGTALDRVGNLFAAEANGGAILRIRPDGTQEPFITQFDFRPLDTPNGVAVHPRTGDVYFTESGTGRLWRVPDSGSPLELFDDGFGFPVGIAFSESGETLFVADRSEGVVLAYEVLRDGSAGTRRGYATIPVPEGLALDVDGNLYVTGTAFGVGGNGIYIVPADGVTDEQVLVPAPDGRLYTAMAFGRAGFDRRTLYMVSVDGSLDAVFLDVEGLPLPAPITQP